MYWKAFADLSPRRKLKWRIKDRILVAVIHAAQISGLKTLTGEQVIDVLIERRKDKQDRAQWRRWYQANRKRQRQLAAYKRISPGFKIDPGLTGLPRVIVP